jgi:hypothetical protein
MHRGAEQRSSILVSEHPYTSVLLPVSSTVGPALLQSFQDTAAKVFHDAMHSWPLPTPGTLTSISIGPHRIVGRVPLDACLPRSEIELWQAVDAPNRPHIAWAPLCGAYGEICIPRTLQAHYMHLWCLWELMLLGRPLMLFCTSPERASSAVLSLLALITPLPYEPDYRPLLSIHDPQVQDVQVCSCYPPEEPLNSKTKKVECHQHPCNHSHRCTTQTMVEFEVFYHLHASLKELSCMQWKGEVLWGRLGSRQAA